MYLDWIYVRAHGQCHGISLFVDVVNIVCFFDIHTYIYICIYMHVVGVNRVICCMCC